MEVKDLFKYDYKLLNELVKYNKKTDYFIKKTIDRFTKECNGIIQPAKYTYLYSYIQKFKGKILERTFAVRHYRGKPQCKEVLRRLEGLDSCIVSDSYFNVGWSGKYLRVFWNYYTWIDDIWNKWKVINIRKSFDALYKPCNFNQLFKIDPSLKYSAIELFNADYLVYLTFYRIHPGLEFFMKLNMYNNAFNNEFMKRVESGDKKFMKYCFKIKDKLKYSAYSYREISFAYENNVDVHFAYQCYGNLGLFKKCNIDIKRLYKYCIDKNITVGEFRDHLDLLLEYNDKWFVHKNLYPENFVEEHSKYLDLQRELTHKEEIERFKKVWKKAVKKCFEDEKYVLICPEKYGDFVYESKIQKNCLVRCNYYEKMANGNCYIYFLRKRDDATMPFITIEYNPKANKVYQCYLAGNISPSKDIKDYVVERLCSVPC